MGLFTAQDSANTISVSMNESFMISLQSNPTTGYAWTSSFEPKGSIEVVSKEYVNDKNNLVGSGGEMSWILQVQKKGTIKLRFIYHRPWEQDVNPLRIVEYTITSN